MLGSRLNLRNPAVHKAELGLASGISQFHGIKQYCAALSEHRGETWTPSLTDKADGSSNHHQSSLFFDPFVLHVNIFFVTTVIL